MKRCMQKVLSLIMTIFILIVFNDSLSRTVYAKSAKQASVVYSKSDLEDRLEALDSLLNELLDKKEQVTDTRDYIKKKIDKEKKYIKEAEIRKGIGAYEAVVSEAEILSSKKIIQADKLNIDNLEQFIIFLNMGCNELIVLKEKYDSSLLVNELSEGVDWESSIRDIDRILQKYHRYLERPAVRLKNVLATPIEELKPGESEPSPAPAKADSDKPINTKELKEKETSFLAGINKKQFDDNYFLEVRQNAFLVNPNGIEINDVQDPQNVKTLRVLPEKIVFADDKIIASFTIISYCDKIDLSQLNYVSYIDSDNTIFYPSRIFLPELKILNKYDSDRVYMLFEESKMNLESLKKGGKFQCIWNNSHLLNKPTETGNYILDLKSNPALAK